MSTSAMTTAIMDEETCVQLIKPHVQSTDVVVSSIGKLTHFLYTHCARDLNFYFRHGMGYASAFALGMAISQPERRVIALDGDGSALMNSQSMAAIADVNPPNLKYVIFNNGCYESTGGQPLPSGGTLDLCKIAEGMGLRNVSQVDTLDEVDRTLETFFSAPGCALLVLKVQPNLKHFPLVSPPFDANEMKYRFLSAMKDGGGEGAVVESAAAALPLRSGRKTKGCTR
ncbi:MAG: hypothetical protein EPO21_21135 [Chloroflexota bacterium]|nr:MAG: hypothetical protein EPO21_21135 [Chloroflexota bacterium]